jgi:hypothetical protein
LERVPNGEIRRLVQAEETILDRIEARKLRWFGHVMRMPEERWPAIIHSWIPPEEGKADDLGVTEAMIKRGGGGRRRPGPDTLEGRIRKAADSRISPYIYVLVATKQGVVLFPTPCSIIFHHL